MKLIYFLAAELTLSGTLRAVPAATEPEALLDLPMEELIRIKITSSTLSDESVLSVPSAMTVYTRQQIRNLGFNSLEELLNFVPGFQSSRTDDSSTARTFSSRSRRLGTGAREVLLLMDGKRLNTDFSGGPVGFNSLISLENVERIEFIRGPGSSIYGSNAVMGVINVITRSGREWQAQGGPGHYATSAQWRLDGDEKSLELFIKQGRDEGQELSICDVDSPDCNRVAPTKILTDTKDPFRHKEAYGRVRWGEWSGRARWAQRTNTQFYADSSVDNAYNFNESTSSYVQLDWSHRFDAQLSLQAQVYDSFIKNTSVEDYSREPLVLADNRLKESEKGSQVLLRSDQKPQRWLLGIEWRQPRVYAGIATPRDPSPDAPSFFVQSGGRTIGGYFAQYQWQWSEGSQLILGFRQDHYSDFGGHGSPRIGIIQQIDAQNTLKLLYSTSFRAPSVIETKILSGSVAGAHLVPEVAINGELVWFRSTRRGQLSTSLYVTEVKDAIHEAVANDGGQRTWVNGHETVSGIECEWQEQLTAEWSLRMAATQILQKAQPINSEASTLLSGSVVYQTGNWTSSLRSNYHGIKRDKTETDGDIRTVEFTRIGDHQVADLHVSHRFNLDLEIFGQVNNLFDRRYASVAQRFTITTGVPERGREAELGMRASF